MELRDNDKAVYLGKGVLKAVANVNEKIAPALLGLDPTQQANIDNIMKELDRTENKVCTGGELNKQEQMGVFFSSVSNTEFVA